METKRILTIDGSNMSVKYLDHDSCTIHGVSFFGSPYTPDFGGWAYMIPDEELKRKWDQIPEETNVLITHGPPFGIGDFSSYKMENAGCRHLATRVNNLPNLKAHIYGHIHHAYGVTERNKVIYANVSTCSNRYDGDINPAVVLDI
jgi:Icc-related predicted phosphoesterase